MTEKQILEEMVAEAKKLPYEEQCMLLRSRVRGSRRS